VNSAITAHTARHLWRKRVLKKILTLGLLMTLTGMCVSSAFAWSNGGWSTDPKNPRYGTHDWIAQHALDWLPAGEKQFIINNLAVYLYGTELPDNPNAPDGSGIGDTAKHHVYYHAGGSLQDDSSAARAQEEYDTALNYARAGDWANASKTLGAMTHYISDVGVFGHVMGSNTDWGSETHHSDYEDYVEAETNNYTATFDSYLTFDGTLDNVTAYDATLTLAFNTTFGDNGSYNCTWMDRNYDWTNPAFKNRCGESLNLAVNLVADVLHTFHQDAIVPEYPLNLVAPAFMTVTLLVAVACKRKEKEGPRALQLQ
jgi:hypothetical protein